jgi:hypothetical protein
MKRIVFVLGMACALGILAVGAQNSPAAGQMNMSQAQMMQACPVKVEGTTVEVADTTDGVAVTFAAKSANVADLQQRVERMANMHTAMGNMQMGQQSMIAGTVKYDPIPNGARMTMKPNDASKLKEFREQVRSRVEQMKKGDCSMMQGMMMQGMMMQGKSGAAEKK